MSPLIEQPNRALDRRRTQMHVPLRRPQVLVAGELLNRARRRAEQTAYALLRHPQISLVLQQRQREQLACLDIKAVDVPEGLRHIAFADVGQAFDPSTGT